MASWSVAEMRTGFCDRPDHIAKPRAAFVKNGSELASSSRRSYCKVPPTGGLMTGAVLKPFEVSEDEVARLAAVELVQLIKRLIEADLQLWGAPLSIVVCGGHHPHQTRSVAWRKRSTGCAGSRAPGRQDRPDAGLGRPVESHLLEGRPAALHCQRALALCALRHRLAAEQWNRAAGHVQTPADRPRPAGCEPGALNKAPS